MQKRLAIVGHKCYTNIRNNIKTQEVLKMQAIVEVKQANMVVEQGVNINALLDKWALYLDATHF